MIDSKKFTGLKWINEEETIFEIPWIHAKKRGYFEERDAALFREWAIHSGKYIGKSSRWKINFRCAMNGLKDIKEIKGMQTEVRKVYQVHPSQSKRRHRTASLKRQEPYPITTTTPYSDCK